MDSLLNRPIGLALLFVALGVGPSPAADSPPVAALKDKGLAKSGHVFVVEDEKAVLEKMKQVRAVATSYSEAADRQAAAEQVVAQVAQLEQGRVELQNNLNGMDQRINEQNLLQQRANIQPGRNRVQQLLMANVMSQLVAERNQVRAGLDEVALQQRTLKASVLPAKAKAALDDDVKTKGEAFKAALAELRPMVDDLTRKYAELAADPAVKAAMAELGKLSKTAAKLGPSDAFVAGAKALDAAERRFLGKKPATAAKKKAKAKK